MRLNDINGLATTIVQAGCVLQPPAVYYHVSDKNHGKSFILRPQKPRYAVDEEPPWPRVCLSPTVGEAIIGSGLFCGPPKKGVFVYQTKEVEAFSVPPELVPDAEDTREHWRLESTEVFLVQVLYPRDVQEVEKQYWKDWEAR